MSLPLTGAKLSFMCTHKHAQHTKLPWPTLTVDYMQEEKASTSRCILQSTLKS